MILKVNQYLIAPLLRLEKLHEKTHRFLQSICLANETVFHLNPLMISIDAHCE
jgi:hypothetical protein